MKKKNEGKHRQLGKHSAQHSCWPEGFRLTNHSMKMDGAECTFVPKVYKTTLTEIELLSCGHMELTMTLMHLIMHLFITSTAEIQGFFIMAGVFKNVAEISLS